MMITDTEYFNIVSEVYDLSDYKTQKAVLFCNEANKTANVEAIVTRLYKHIQSKITGIDFGTIPDSKGILTKVENYEQLLDCIAAIKELLVQYNEDTRIIDEVSTCLTNIQTRERIFTKAFALNIDFPIMIYNSTVLAAVSSVSLMIATSIEYIKNGHDSYAVALDKSRARKSKDHVLFQYIKQFNVECRNGHLDKAMNECIKNNMTKVSESTIYGDDDYEAVNEFWFIISVISLAFTTIRILFGLLRRMIYWFLHTRMRASDWFAMQAEFLQINAENLKYREDEKGDDHKKKVYERQMKWVERLKKWSNMLALKNLKAQKEAEKDDNEYNRKRKEDDSQDYGDDNGNDDGGLF